MPFDWSHNICRNCWDTDYPNWFGRKETEFECAHSTGHGYYYYFQGDFKNALAECKKHEDRGEWRIACKVGAVHSGLNEVTVAEVRYFHEEYGNWDWDPRDLFCDGPAKGQCPNELYVADFGGLDLNERKGFVQAGLCNDWTFEKSQYRISNAGTLGF